MKKYIHLITIALCAFGFLTMTACSKEAEDHLDDAGDSISEAADETGEAITDAAKQTKETLEEHSTEPKIDSSNK